MNQCLDPLYTKYVNPTIKKNKYKSFSENLLNKSIWFLNCITKNPKTTIPIIKIFPLNFGILILINTIHSISTLKILGGESK